MRAHTQILAQKVLVFYIHRKDDPPLRIMFVFDDGNHDSVRLLPIKNKHDAKGESSLVESHEKSPFRRVCGVCIITPLIRVRSHHISGERRANGRPRRRTPSQDVLVLRTTPREADLVVPVVLAVVVAIVFIQIRALVLPISRKL